VTPPAITHNSVAQRFETTVGGHLSVAEYRLDGNAIIFTPTEVPEALQGRGLASQLVEAAVTFARTENKRIVSECRYVTAWLARHPYGEKRCRPPQRKLRRPAVPPRTRSNSHIPNFLQEKYTKKLYFFRNRITTTPERPFQTINPPLATLSQFTCIFYPVE